MVASQRAKLGMYVPLHLALARLSLRCDYSAYSVGCIGDRSKGGGSVGQRRLAAKTQDY